MKLTIVQANITYLETDAIVNAANSMLHEGGGVCGAIFGAVKKLGGSEGHNKLTRACNTIGHCPTGSAVITPSFGLKAPFIIHAVGPVWNGRKGKDFKSPFTDNEIEQFDELSSAYRAVLRVCRENNLTSVAIPGISTGIYGFPKMMAAYIAKSICTFEADGIDVTLVAYNDEALTMLQNVTPRRMD